MESKDFFLLGEVERGCKDMALKIDTICQARGETWLEVYKDLGFHKTFASRVKRAHIIPPLWQRIKIARRLGCDSSLIWDVPVLRSADKIKGEPSGESNPHEAASDGGEDEK